MDPIDDESLRMFLVEAGEHLETLEAELLAIEAGEAGWDAERVNRLFRSAHTVKGGAGFFGLEEVKGLAHAMESLLNRAREGRLVPDLRAARALLEATDGLRTLLRDPAAGGAGAAAARAALDAVAEGGEGPEAARPAPSAESEEPARFEITPSEAEAARRATPGGPNLYTLAFPLPEAEGPGRRESILEDLKAWCAILAERVVPAREGGGTLHVLCATIVDPGDMPGFAGLPPEAVVRFPDPAAPAVAAGPAAATAEAPVPAPPTGGAGEAPAPRPGAGNAGRPGPGGGEPARAEAAEPLVRVRVSQLDRLMSLAGELVLTRNALVQALASGGPAAVGDAAQRVDSLTSEMQEAIMRTRMQPLGGVLGKFRRIARDLARELGKEIRLEIEGEDVEVDRTIAEALADPLVHLVRNAADHGIEAPAARKSAGKPPAGLLRLSARHQAGCVILAVADDGAGIDPARMRAKAREKGLLPEAQLDAMGDDEARALIFAPGFSTAREVSDISGRGVGMDVVRASLAKVGGTVDIESRVGEGTTFLLKLPLTLAIIPSLLVAAGEERFAIPQVNLVELVRVSGRDGGERAVARIGGVEVLRLRGELLPLVHLAALLGDAAAARPAGHVVVVAAGELRYALAVDRLLDSTEIVVKPLGRHLASNPAFAGATILGDAHVALILDMAGLGRLAGLGEACRRAAAPEGPAAEGADAQTWLLVENGPGETFALPMGLVARIEKARESDLVRVGERLAMTYRGGSLALLSLEEVARVAPRRRAEALHVVVFRRGGREVGLLVSDVLDTVQGTAEIDAEVYAQPGVLGAAVLEGRIVQVLDLQGLAARLVPGLARPADSGAAGKTVLVVEDTPFFQGLFRSCLEEAGFRVRLAGDGAAGLEAMAAGGVDLVLTDIEMPRLDGNEMARRLRADPRFARIPIVAVTSLDTKDAERRGRAAGMTEYMAKFDRDRIVEACRRLLGAGVPGGGAVPGGWTPVPAADAPARAPERQRQREAG